MVSGFKKYKSLDGAVRDLFGEERMIAKRRHVSGGDINDAFALELDDGSLLFMKSNAAGAVSNFEAEASGLKEIRATGAIRVPEVLGLGTDGACSFLLLEYVGGGRKVSRYWEIFAAELAAMHRADPTAGRKYGLEEDNWIGARKQRNTPHDSWISFFRDCRLAPQFDAAKRYFTGRDYVKIERLLTNLDRFLVEPEGPSLVHGDLWAGNMITGSDGKGWLIDPAVYYGHPEADLAMTELFGGFPDLFYDAYKEAGNLQPGYRDRRDIYNLYQLLNHLNMFGAGYLSEVKYIVNRYAGIA